MAHIAALAALVTQPPSRHVPCNCNNNAKHPHPHSHPHQSTLPPNKDTHPPPPPPTHLPPLPLRHTWRRIFAACEMVPAVSIMSSTSTATLPFTSPIRFMTSLTLCALRRLSTMAKGASFSFLANPRALHAHERVCVRACVVCACVCMCGLCSNVYNCVALLCVEQP